MKTSGGNEYLALRPLLSDFVLSMPRGAAVVYPKDAGQIVQMADIFPGARVVEAGVGSGALTCSLLRAVGDAGQRALLRAPRGVRRDRGEERALLLRRRAPGLGADHRRPGGEAGRTRRSTASCWTCSRLGLRGRVAKALVPGGVLVCYVATTTQLSRTVETLRTHGAFTEPQPWESMVRGWHVEGLAVRPDHRMIGHTGFLVTARRLADGVTPPVRRRRPSKGAYAADYVAEGATPAAGSVADPAFNEDGTVTSSVARRVLP